MKQVMSPDDGQRHVQLPGVSVGTICDRPVDPRGAVMNAIFCEECEDFWNTQGASHGMQAQVRESARRMARANAGKPQRENIFESEPHRWIVVSARGRVSRFHDEASRLYFEDRLSYRRVEYAVYELRKVERG